MELKRPPSCGEHGLPPGHRSEKGEPSGFDPPPRTLVIRSGEGPGDQANTCAVHRGPLRGKIRYSSEGAESARKVLGLALCLAKELTCDPGAERDRLV